jgi:hypothetical protein
MQPSRWGYFITIIGAGITPGSAWRRSAWRPLRANARRYPSMSPRVAGAGRNRRTISRDPRGRRHSSRRARFAHAPDAPRLSSDPERFHAQRSVIAQDLAELARRIAPRARRTSELEVELSERRRGRIVVATTQAINGRRIWSRSAVRSRFTLVNHQ